MKIISIWLRHISFQLAPLIAAIGAVGLAACLVIFKFVVVVVVFSLEWLWWKQLRLEAKVFAIACLGALILNQGLKLFFAKPRPQL